VPAAAADHAAGWLRLAPAVPIPPVPDAVLGTQRPLPAFAVDDSKLADGGPERARVEGTSTPVTEQRPVTHLRLTEGIDRHRASI
jgi:hypothetical protein